MPWSKQLRSCTAFSESGWTRSNARKGSRTRKRVGCRAMEASTLDDVQPVENETRDRIITGAITAIPFAALIVVGWQLWNKALHWSDLIVFLLLYVLLGFGVTVG